MRECVSERASEPPFRKSHARSTFVAFFSLQLSCMHFASLDEGGAVTCRHPADHSALPAPAPPALETRGPGQVKLGARAWLAEALSSESCWHLGFSQDHSIRHVPRDRQSRTHVRTAVRELSSSKLDAHCGGVSISSSACSPPFVGLERMISRHSQTRP